MSIVIVILVYFTETNVCFHRKYYRVVRLKFDAAPDSLIMEGYCSKFLVTSEIAYNMQYDIQSKVHCLRFAGIMLTT